MTRKLSFSSAINEAMKLAMRSDENVILLGEDVAGGAQVDHLQDDEAWEKFDPYLDGTVVDFYDGLEKRGFVFNNPNVVKSCGCGSSFQV